MRKIVLVFLVLGVWACKKNKDSVSSNSLLGSWRYVNSILDSGNNRTMKFYDSSVGANLGDTLRFIKPDTVYYTYLSSTTWSNFSTWDRNLVLIGGVNRDTLPIHSLSGQELQLGLPVVSVYYSYWAVFERYNP